MLNNDMVYLACNLHFLSKEQRDRINFDFSDNKGLFDYGK